MQRSTTYIHRDEDMEHISNTHTGTQNKNTKEVKGQGTNPSITKFSFYLASTPSTLAW